MKVSGVKKTSQCDVFSSEVAMPQARQTFEKGCVRPPAPRFFKPELNMGEFPSGQRGQTVNLLLFSFDGSNPSSPTKLEEYHRKVGALLIFG